MSRRDWLWLLLITLLGLGLRLLVWRWREFQPLGGDEQEYFDAALALLQERRYQELLFMRPPLYPVILAAWIYVADSLVQNLRLIQALVSTATIPLIALLTLELARAMGHARPARPALLAATLCALSYTLAANAAELLTETVFLFGLTLAIGLILKARDPEALPYAAAAGLVVGALCLVRSVALPLLPLGALWLFLAHMRPAQPGPTARVQPPAQAANGFAPARRRGLPVALAFGLCVLLVVLPWTARNYLAYGGLILIDTTGAENLWLDNDPAGREAVKAQLFALGEDRLQRQQLGSRNGLAVIAADPARFAAKAWGELTKFFALEFADDMLARPVIWVRPADTWLRLLLGDALWLVLLLAGIYGLARGLFAAASQSPQPEATTNEAAPQAAPPLARFALGSPAWLLAPWALYVLLTTLIFHVELRYRLPLFPALLPFAALTLAQVPGTRNRRVEQPPQSDKPGMGGSRFSVLGLPLAIPLLCLALTLLHANYPALAWRLGWKHTRLALAEAALARGDSAGATRAAEAALASDERSALARVALARAALLNNAPQQARTLLDAALALLPDHPQARVLRGDLLRAAGDTGGAQRDLAFETATQQDLQGWLWTHAFTPPPGRLELGDGLDLGFVRGFHGRGPADAGFRWSTGAAELRLAAPPGATELVLRMASGRPPAAPPVELEVLIDGAPAGRFSVGAAWQAVRLPIDPAASELIVALRAPTFTPRQYDPASPDGRRLGVQLDWAEVR